MHLCSANEMIDLSEGDTADWAHDDDADADWGDHY